jgi:chemotaxis protein CheD
MGEWVVGSDDGTVLTCIGLGSCIGLALIDRRARLAGLAHVMLPEIPGGAGVARPTPAQPGKFADCAVPGLVDELLGLGAARHRLEAVLVGGAQMFAFGSGVVGRDIGARNEAAVRVELDRVRVPVRAAATGGGKGRSMRVDVRAGEVVYKEAAGRPITLLEASPDLLRQAA